MVPFFYIVTLLGIERIKFYTQKLKAMEHVIFVNSNSKLLNQLYSDFEKRYQKEQALLSDLSMVIYLESIRYFNLNDLNKAKAGIYALATWLSKDVQYFIRKNYDKQGLYEYDLVSSLQLMGQLINICEDFKQFDVATTIQKEYSKLNIKYSLMKVAA